MPHYSNSLLRPDERPSRRCEECTNPRCEGLHSLRTFTSWNDLASHLDEADILHFVNRLNDIWVEYMTLKGAHETREASHLRQVAERRALLEAAKHFLSTQPAPPMKSVVVTMPMRSRQARQGSVAK